MELSRKIFFKELKSFCVYLQVGCVSYFGEIKRNRYPFHNLFQLKGREAKRQMGVRTTCHPKPSQEVALYCSEWKWPGVWRAQGWRRWPLQQSQYAQQDQGSRCAGGWRALLLLNPLLVDYFSTSQRFIWICRMISSGRWMEVFIFIAIYFSVCQGKIPVTGRSYPSFRISWMLLHSTIKEGTFARESVGEGHQCH